MSDEEINKIANQISFRLMATNKHPDHMWLVNILKKFYENSSNSA
jgi:hypothetical protein